MDLQAYLTQATRKVDQALAAFLPKANAKPATIHKAMRYSIFAGGKRLRPVLALAASEICGGIGDTGIHAACAVECIHTYSLIHDDLPCMDDDDLRRGRPTNHKVFGEGIAVLAGDALLTAAFEILAREPQTSRYSTADYIIELAETSGSKKLIAGQVMDIEGEGKPVSKSQLQFIHLAKTSALLTTSIRLGAMCANATESKLLALTQFGQSLGLAFQVIDDILDVTQTTEKLGKTAGKDVAATKATYPALFGLERARKIAAGLTAEALGALQPFGKKARTLEAIAESLLVREY
jgi:geranylgeranyl diphosphate synthase, type II